MNVVGYVRISRDDEGANSSSINSQKDIIYDYAKKRNWTVSKIYEDDNYSGYSMDRPDFNEMIKEAEKGKVNTILAKDLSRIGRNNGGVLVLVEKLRELNVRLILISEGNGGLDLLEDENDILGIKTWYNEMYIKDISKKIRANMHLKQKSGELVMGNFYGYQKIKIADSFKLLPDYEIKPIIELIFKLYIDGLGYKKICDVLNEKGYPTPSQYIKQRHEKNGRVFRNAATNNWQTHMIQRIIQNDIYIGTFRTKKRQARLIKGKQEKVPKEQQYAFENHHEALINKEDFMLTQDINKKRVALNYRKNKAKYDYVFSGFMQCGDCGFTVIGLNLKRNPLVERGYNCTMYQKYGLKQCSNHSVKEEKVLFFFKEFLKDVKVEFEEYINNIKINEKKENLKSSLDNMQKDLYISKEELKLTLNQKIKDLLKEESIESKAVVESAYEEIETDKKKKISEITKKIRELENINSVDIENNLKTNIDIFDNIINSDRPQRKHLEMILDKILVYKDRTLEFKLKIDIKKLTYYYDK